MPGEQQPESNAPAPLKSPGARRRGHRGGRGRRRPAPAVPITGQPAQVESPISETKQPVRPLPPGQRFQSAVPVPRVLRADGSAIGQAVNEIMQVVESLRQSLEQMEDVLELVELAERQKITDEREIESLLRALRQLQSRGGRSERHDRSQPDAEDGRGERSHEL